MRSQQNLKKLLYTFVLLSILIYRGYIIFTYCKDYVDDDQGIMWYATVALSHGLLEEPHYYGQSYGSLMEALAAVPLYLLHIPLNIALPISTTILWVLPFILLSMKAYRKNYALSVLILIIALSMNYDYDVLTAIPRSFISGFFLTFIGGLMLIESRKRFFVGFGFFLMCLGYISTETTIYVSVIFFLYMGLYSKDLKQRLISCLFAAVPSLALLYFSNWGFYLLNPEYNLHSGKPIAIGLSFFTYNVRNIQNILISFSVLKHWIFPLAGLTGLAVFCILKKKTSMSFILLSIIVVSLSCFATSKAGDFSPTVLFSQTRMFLFVIYLVILFLYFMACDRIFFIKIPSVHLGSIAAIFTVFLVLLVSFKIYTFQQILSRPNWLVKDYLLLVYSTKDIKQASQQVIDIARENKADLIVTVSDTRGFGYALSALEYDNNSFYNAFYDRRTWIYLDEKHKKRTGNVLLISYQEPGIQSEVIALHDESIIDWLREKKQIQRYPVNSPYYLRSSTTSSR